MRNTADSPIMSKLYANYRLDKEAMKIQPLKQTNVKKIRIVSAHINTPL